MLTMTDDRWKTWNNRWNKFAKVYLNGIWLENAVVKTDAEYLEYF